MKPCKTLYLLATATIVMLTAGCARQAVKPIPIRYNFLEHIPDYDPMLLDTESVKEAVPAPRDTSLAAASGDYFTPRPFIHFQFPVNETPDRDPMLLCDEIVADAQKPLLATAFNESRSQRPSIRYRFPVNELPAPDPMLSNIDTIHAKREAAIAASARMVMYR